MFLSENAVAVEFFSVSRFFEPESSFFEETVFFALESAFFRPL